MTDNWTRESLLELGAGFLKSRILLSAAELDLFSKLSHAPGTVHELCEQEGWDPRGLTILLDALAAMRLVSKSPRGQYGLDASLSDMLVRGKDVSLLPMILHRVHLWRSWSNLTEIVRTGINPNPVGGDQRSDEETEAFIGAMHAIAQGMAETIADAIDLSRYTKMLDVGGGPGTYIQAFLQKAPGLRATLFDLPRVIDIARRRLIEPGIRDRVDFVEGDYEADELPVGYNLVLLSAIIHSNSRDGNRKLYEKIYASVIPGGDIIIRDHIMDATRTVPQDGAIFAVNMLVATEGGNSYTFDEVREDLEKAGFKDVRVIREGQRMDQLVSATK